MFTDSHCHLFKEYYDNIDEELKEAKEEGITKVISSSTSLDSCKEMLELSKKDMVYITLGIHPEDANTFKEKDLSFIEDNLHKPKVVAIGEIGLDYHYEGFNKDKQIKLFKAQLELAEKYHMPVVIHSRDATQDTINILKDYKITGVIHSFSGSAQTAKEYIKLGYKIGINGVITFKNAHLKDTIKEIGLKNIILETDSPYLTPHPYRGKRNSPLHIIDIANFITGEFKVTKDDLSNITEHNIKSIFKI